MKSMTNEEFRNIEKKYMREADEAERITAMLEKIREHIGPVASSAITLNGISAAMQWIPTNGRCTPNTSSG